MKHQQCRLQPLNANLRTGLLHSGTVKTHKSSYLVLNLWGTCAPMGTNILPGGMFKKHVLFLMPSTLLFLL